jgi:hypothetical protein
VPVGNQIRTSEFGIERWQRSLTYMAEITRTVSNVVTIGSALNIFFFFGTTELLSKLILS